MTTIVYTDGACLGNPGPGGWAWAIPGGRYASGAEPTTTNQRMEITAALEAVRANEGRLEIVSDSTYVVNCFRDRWWEGWLARGWTTSQRKPVANRDLWEPLIELYLARRGELAFRWVKGHADDVTNDLVDRLAVDAARTQQGRSGSGLPSDLGPPDHVTKDPRLGAGRFVVVGGLRPPELGGWGENPVATAVRARMREILAAKLALHPDLVVVSGLDLGAEQLGALAARDAGVPLVAVLAFPEQQVVWPQHSRAVFDDLLASARSSVLVQDAVPESPRRVAAAFARRNGFLAANADEALVVWDGTHAGVGRFVRSMQYRLGDDVWVLDPSEL